MLDLLTKYGFIGICLAVFLEELGVPMPIPTDILIVIAGVEAGKVLPRLVIWFVLISIASALGSSGLYMIARRGGRPLVERFGRYVHLGPEQLAKSEALLLRTGWAGIAVGRAIPGLRYVTVIACGLLRISYAKFITAHLVGSSVYVMVFLALGAVFGKPIIDRIHAPELTIRLLWLLALAVGLPLLLIWFCYRGHVHPAKPPSRMRTMSAVLVASFAGATALAATWATAATLAQLLGSTQTLDLTRMLVAWLLGRGVQVTGAYTLIYTGLLLLCVAVGALYYELILPHLAPRGTSLPRQVLGLALLVAALGGSMIAPLVLLTRTEPLIRLSNFSGMLLPLTVAIGIFCYALTTAYGRTLAIAVLPSLRRAPVEVPLPATIPEPPAVPEPPTLQRDTEVQPTQ